MNAAENRALSAEQQVKDMQTEMKAAENRALSAEQQVKDLQKEVLQAEEISTLITTETEVREESAQQILTTDVKVLKMEKMQHVQLVSKR